MKKSQNKNGKLTLKKLKITRLDNPMNVKGGVQVALIGTDINTDTFPTKNQVIC